MARKIIQLIAFDDWLHALADDGTWWQKNAAGWSRCEDLPQDAPDEDIIPSGFKLNDQGFLVVDDTAVAAAPTSEPPLGGRRLEVLWRPPALMGYLYLVRLGLEYALLISGPDFLQEWKKAQDCILVEAWNEAEAIQTALSINDTTSDRLKSSFKIGEERYEYFSDIIPF